MSSLTLAIPSKGRLMEQCAECLGKAGFTIERSGTDRGYRGILRGIDDVEVAFLSASEIAQNLRDGKIDLGVTGVPETFVIDKEGVIRFKQIGPVTPEVLRDQIIPLVRKLGA